MTHTSTPPAELTERFTPAENARIELVREDGDVRLWKSTVTRPMPDGSARELVKFHVSEGCSCFALFVSSLDTATEHFEYGAANQEIQLPDDSRYFFNRSLLSASAEGV